MTDKFELLYYYMYKATDECEKGNFEEGYKWLDRFNSCSIKDDPNCELIQRHTLLEMIIDHKNYEANK